MKKHFIAVLALCFSLIACTGTKKISNPIVFKQAYTGEIKIKGLGENIPEDAVLLGNVAVGEAGLTRTNDCTYQKVLAELVELAKGMGGNMLMITEYKEPDGHSSCHQLKANVYWIEPQK